MKMWTHLILVAALVINVNSVTITLKENRGRLKNGILTVNKGETISLICSIRGQTNSGVWMQEGTPISTGDRMIGNIDERYGLTADMNMRGRSMYTLTIKDIQEQDAGVFRCTAGSDYDTVTISVEGGVEDQRPVHPIVDYPAEPVDECPEFCPLYYDPMCGTDGITYGNPCQLDVRACQLKRDENTDLSLDYEGECQADAECPVFCPLVYTPVCGTDGTTYGNECALKAHACVQNVDVNMAHTGECLECPAASVGCSNEYSPVCGTDDKTYINECLLMTIACDVLRPQNMYINVGHPGKCQGPSDCVRPCTREYNPVCGFDGNLYSNMCELENAACQINIDPMDLLKNYGVCATGGGVITSGGTGTSGTSLGQGGCATIKPRPIEVDDLGLPNLFRGWVDVQGQGANNDYCRVLSLGRGRRILSCALAGSTSSAHAYTSPDGSFDAGYADTWYMKDEDADGRDDYCRCVRAGRFTEVSCLKACEQSFCSEFQIQGTSGCQNNKVNPFFGV